MKIEQFVSKYEIDKKIPTQDIQDWVRENLGVPTRTFQWYAKEGLIPASQEKEGRNRFYSIEQFYAVVKWISITRALKRATTVRYTSLKKINSNTNNLEKVIELLENMINNYPVYEFKKDDFDNMTEVYNSVNDSIWGETVKRLEAGEDADKIMLTDIEDIIVGRDQKG